MLAPGNFAEEFCPQIAFWGYLEDSPLEPCAGNTIVPRRIEPAQPQHFAECGGKYRKDVLSTFTVDNKDARLLVCRPEVGRMTGTFTPFGHVWLLHKEQRNRDLGYKPDAFW